jgi:hypothetical protein
MRNPSWGESKGETGQPVRALNSPTSLTSLVPVSPCMAATALEGERETRGALERRERKIQVMEGNFSATACSPALVEHRTKRQ